ncbi:SRPBCC family protein [Thermomonospora amylolytica]|uniref:SRPBCC family protein n=1 Tax=Thermomonospora amylolytica TaxID=1411117 RepID=UPI000E6CA5DD|nr:SRPBCC family protein [Thermomonospora amylolytica]
MSRVSISADVTCDAPADKVFEVLTDWPRHAEWMPFTKAEGGHGVGAALVGRTGVGPVGFTDTMVITEWTPGRRVAVRHTGRLVRGEAWFETAPLPGGGSTVLWAERLDLPLGPLGRAGWVLLRRPVRALMLLGLRRLVRLAGATR